MTRRPEPCPICKVSDPDTKCDNTIRPGEPLPGRDYHHARMIEKETTNVL